MAHPGPPPEPCFDCTHFIGMAEGEPEDEIINGVEVWTEKDPAFVCRAYPKGIPADILSGRNRHRRPRAGDNGIQYEQEI